MKLGDYRPGALKIFTVRLGEGCAENCLHCGAYPLDKSKAPGDFVAREVTRERIKECLVREFDLQPYVSFRKHVNGGESGSTGSEVPDTTISTRCRLVDLFANYVTTDVNQEPLNGDAFLHFAQLVKELSGGKSRAVCISHGLRARKLDEADLAEFNSVHIQRLKEIVDFMEEGDVFVLSIDMSRAGGKMDSDINFQSYLETLKMLKPALDKGARITVSIQGDNDSGSPFFRGRAGNLYDELCEELVTYCGWTQSEVASVHIDTGRSWVRAGRAQALPGVDPNGECPVIPYNRFVQNTLSKSRFRGFLDTETGGVWVHPNNEARSYNDDVRLSRHLSARGLVATSKLGPWEEVEVNNTPLEDLRAQFSRDARLSWLKSIRAASLVAAKVEPIVAQISEGAPASGFQRDVRAEPRSRRVRRKAGQEGVS